MLVASQRAAYREEWLRERRTERLAQVLHGVSEILVTEPAPTSLSLALTALCSLLELRGAALTLAEPLGDEGSELDFWRGPPHPSLTTLAREGARRVLHDQVPLIVENAWLELGDSPALANIWPETQLDTSLVGVPVRELGQTMGVLVIVREHSAGDQAAFQFDEDVRLLGSITKLLAVVCQVARLARRNRETRKAHPPDVDQTANAVGVAVCWRATLQKAQTAARSNATVLLRGETGVGKNVIARLVHEASQRHTRPFIAINCAALPESLLESELFGHERGAFTGAISQHKGRFELAHTGTLFLDEIGELSATFQAKLLRVLQEGQFERVGGSETLSVDVRVIAATHRDLEASVQRGVFRADLYYRLCVIPVLIPPLRERPEDIALLARTFLSRFNEENGHQRALDDTALRALLTYPFPGNVRELENAIRRAASLSARSTLSAEDFSFLSDLRALSPSAVSQSSAPPSAARARPPTGRDRALLGEARGLSPERVIEALERSGWVLAKAARLLGVTPRQISYAIQKHHITVHKY